MEYTALRAKSDTADNLRRFSRILAIKADRNVTLVDALAAAIACALRHIDEPETIGDLPAGPDAGDG